MSSITLFPTVPEQRTVLKPYVFLAFLQLLDVLTTGWILHNIAEASEGNPIVDSILSSVGLFGGLTVLLALKLGVVYTMWNFQSKIKLANFIYSAVIANNVLFLILAVLN